MPLYYFEELRPSRIDEHRKNVIVWQKKIHVSDRKSRKAKTDPNGGFVDLNLSIKSGIIVSN